MFSEQQAEQLAGLTGLRLRSWIRQGLFVPSFVDGEAQPYRLPYSRLYSFKDVVVLRTLSILRNSHKLPLQQLRIVCEELGTLRDDGWAGATLNIEGKKVLLQKQSGTADDLSLGMVVAEITEAMTKLRQRPAGQIGQLDRSPDVLRNAWVVAGTRIPVKAIQGFHEEGYTSEQIIQEYPDLTMADVQAALRHEEMLGTAA